jgi:hypothetical protein
MPVVRIIASDLVSDQVHREALKENRTLSAMGQVLLREALSARRSAAVEQEQLLRGGMEQRLVRLIKGIPGDADAAS